MSRAAPASAGAKSDREESGLDRKRQKATATLPELTPTENVTYITALDEHDWPAWFREMTGLDLPLPYGINPHA